MAMNLNQLQNAATNFSSNLPLDEQIRAFASATLPSLQELSPEDLKNFARDLKDSADNLLRDENALHFILLAATVLPQAMKQLQSGFASEHAFENAEKQKALMGKVGKKKWVEAAAAYNSVFPPALSAIFRVKTTKKALSAEFDEAAKMSLEEFENKVLDQQNRISQSLNRLQSKLTVPSVTLAAKRFIGSMTPEQTETLICTGAAFFKDLFENAQNNNPLTVTDTRQGKEFAKALHQSLVFLETALEEAGVIDVPQQRKSSAGPAAPKNI